MQQIQKSCRCVNVPFMCVQRCVRYGYRSWEYVQEVHVLWLASQEK